MTVVLDSWAVLALLEGHSPAAGTVEALLSRERPVMSWINLGEVSYVIERRHGAVAAADTLRDVLAVVDAELPTTARVLAAASLKAGHPLSYADAFAAATAMAHSGEVWTGDSELLVSGAGWQWRDLR
jgi:ribonuclease VapC